MGSGKTTVGKNLSERLNFSFLDLDKWIEHKEKRGISDIFSIHGENYFRKAESEALKEVYAGEKKIIALGGGTVCFNSNLQMIKKNSLLIYLKAEPEELANRLGMDYSQRPLLANKSKGELRSFIEHHLAERETFYRQAHIIINATQCNTEGLVASILKFTKAGK